MRRIGTAAALAVALVVVPMVAPSCSGAQPAPQVAEALSQLPEALQEARQALEVARPVLEAAGDDEAERRAVAAALDAMEGVLELGEALCRDLGRATERGGWAWADAILGALAGVLHLVKDLGVPIPDAIVAAADAAVLLLPALAGAGGGGGV